MTAISEFSKVLHNLISMSKHGFIQFENKHEAIMTLVNLMNWDLIDIDVDNPDNKYKYVNTMLRRYSPDSNGFYDQAGSKKWNLVGFELKNKRFLITKND